MLNPSKPNRRPRFSLAVITYNSSRTILETLRSLEGLEGLDDVELILADDASTDETVELLTRWVGDHASLFGSVVTVFPRENRGISAMHTLAFSGAVGEWGLYLGGDDLIENPGFFSQLSGAIDKVPGRFYRTRVSEYYAEENRRNDFYDSYGFFRGLSASRQFRYLASTGNPFRSGPGSVFHVETLRQLDGFGTYNRMYEDWQLFLRFTRAGYPIQILNLPGVLWRRHAFSVSSGSNEKMRSFDRIVQRKEIIPYLNRLSLFERWKFRHSGRVSTRLNRVYIRYLGLLGRLSS